MTNAPGQNTQLRAHLARGGTLGGLVGAATGSLELLGHWLSGSPMVTRHFLFPVMVFYALLWGVLGLCLGLLRGWWRRETGLQASDIAWYLTVLIGSAVVVVVGGYVNLYWLPAFVSMRSLVFDGLLLGGVLLLGRVIVYPVMRWLATRAQHASARQRRLGRLGMLAVAAGAALATYVPAPQSHEPSRSASGVQAPCNVLLIVMDATRADHLSAYGYSRASTPNLARLAKRGVLFRNAMANTSWTHPSIPTILTSLYPSTHQVNLIGSGLHPSIPTLSQLLKPRGMATAIVTGNSFISPLFGFGRGVDHFVHGARLPMEQLIVGHVLRRLLAGHSTLRTAEKYAVMRFDRLLNPHASATAEDTSARALNRAFLSWVEEIRPQRFFAYVHYLEPHMPYDPPESSKNLFAPGADATLSERVVQGRGILPFYRGEPLAPAAHEQLVGLYDAEIQDLDAAIGELLEGLQRLGIEEDTVIIVTADHGEEFFEHGGWGHGQSLYQELLHVPLIISYPGHLPEARVIDAPVSHIDLTPTILALCGGIEPGLFVEGRSLLPLIEGSDEGFADRPVYSELYLGGASARAWMRGRYKLIVSEDGQRRQVALYDVQDDPAETRDLSGQRPDVTASLLEELEATTRRASERSRGRVAAKLDAATSDQLRALGYLQ